MNAPAFSLQRSASFEFSRHTLPPRSFASSAALFVSFPSYRFPRPSFFSAYRSLGLPFSDDKRCLTSRVSACAPSYFRVESIIQRTPMGRWADADEVSGVVAFLCMRGAGYITSQVISTDGGFTANGWMT